MTIYLSAHSSIVLQIHLLNAGGTCIVRIAYDWIGGNIYYTDRSAHRVGFCNLVRQFCTVILSKEDGVVGDPIAIALHPKIGRVFWGNQNLGGSASIYSANMDGSSPVKVAGTGISYPTGIAIDLENSRIYWTDLRGNKIESCTMDGEERYVVAILAGSPGPAGIDIMGDYLYWGEITANRIWSMTQTFGCQTTGPALLYDEGERIHDLKVYDGSKQPLDRENPCICSGCSHLCALSGEEGVRCLCPAGIELGADGKTCHSNCTLAAVVEK